MHIDHLTGTTSRFERKANDDVITDVIRVVAEVVGVLSLRLVIDGYV